MNTSAAAGNFAKSNCKHFLVAVFFLFTWSSTASADVPNGPITDQQGRIRFIIDLFDDATGKPSKFAGADDEIAWHKTRSAELIDAVIKLRGVEPVASTSLVGTSFTAFLTGNQLEQFSKDKRVRRVTQDSYIAPSALWNSIIDPSGQVRPWGMQAMGAGGGAGGGTTTYVLDTGVHLHPDLTGYSATDQLVALPGLSPAGCYPHGTHIAGIIGAADNQQGVVGVAPGVHLVSISISTIVSSGGQCEDVVTVAALVQALEMVKTRGIESHTVGIVNLSFNAGGDTFSSTSTVGEKMRNVAHPDAGYIYNYPGALIVQSAGNGYGNACDVAYNAPAAGDGILVVGGLDDNGQPVKPFSSGLGGYINVEGDARKAEPGSNYGGCVEVWAPSQRILSTWSGGGTQLLSGTSMAAPHVAGFAARILASNGGIANSWQLEEAVRTYFVSLAGSGLAMPQFTSQLQTAKATVDIVLDIAPGSGQTTNDVRTSSLDTINVVKFPEALNLRMDAVGYANCYSTRYQVGVYYPVTQSGQPPFNLSAGLGPGDYTWTATCYSPQGASTAASAHVRIAQHVSTVWSVNTTSTLGQILSIPHGGQVTWAINAPFDQTAYGYGADNCSVESYGFTGNSLGDFENPDFNSFVSFSQTLLWWNSGNWNYYPFGALYLADPQNSPYGLPPVDGYKWKLRCWNADESKTTIMYGRLQ